MFSRGLLCTAHNTAIGKFNDDPALLRAAADYLEQAAATAQAKSHQEQEEEVSA